VDASDAAVALAAVGWLDLGIARDAIGDHDGAATAFQTALVLRKDLAPAAAGNIAAMARKGDPKGAVAAANAWLSHHPADAPVRVNLAGAIFLRNDVAGALDAAADALAFDAGLGVARRAVVEYALDAHRPELALFAARQAVQLAPADPRAAETLGSALRRAGLDRIHGRAAGREALAAASARFPNDARLAHAAGVAALEDGDPAAARELLERAALHAPSTETWIALADARRVTGDAAGAADAATKAHSRQPGLPAALENLGLAHADALEFAGAEAAFKDYIERTEGARAADDPVPAWLEDTMARREKQEVAP
jgi:tetratricopeptide (TPR) repeat protein